MRKTGWLLAAVFTLAFLLRMIYCWNLPLSGDESVSLLQAAGKAADFSSHIPTEPAPIEKLQNLMKPSTEYGCRAVLKSMEKAGMHPPFYYLFLHYAMKIVGSDLRTLRLFSVLFASLSVIVLFYLVKDILNAEIGVAAAFLLAISPYAVQYASMIRPYPLAMLLSLLSTWLLIRYIKTDSPKTRRTLLILYILTIVTGFYSIYIFLFVFIFQMTFLLLWKPFCTKNWLRAAGICLLAGLLYLPWLPSFHSQIQTVQSQHYYFYGKSNPLKTMEVLFSGNFTEAFPGTYAWYKFLILAFVAFFCVRGFWDLFKQKLGRLIVFSFAAYLASNYLADLAMKSATINVYKFLFFLTPGLFLFLAAGFNSDTRFPLWKRASLVCLTGLLAINLFVSFKAPRTDDGPYYVKEFTAAVNQAAAKTQKNLILLNTTQRRDMLSFAYAIRGDADFAAVINNQAMEENLKKSRLSAYDQIFIVQMGIQTLSAGKEGIDPIQQIMDSNRWEQKESETFSFGTSTDTLSIYQKQPTLTPEF